MNFCQENKLLDVQSVICWVIYAFGLCWNLSLPVLKLKKLNGDPSDHTHPPSSLSSCPPIQNIPMFECDSAFNLPTKWL